MASCVPTVAFLCILFLSLCCRQAEALSLSLNMTLGYDDGSLTIFNCPASSTLYRKCNKTAYDWVVFTWALPSLVVAGLLFLFFFLYIFGKYCCNCCGGRKQSPNFCCPEKSLPALYSPFDLMRPLFFSVVCVLLCGVGCVWCCVGTADMYSLLREMSAVLTNANNNMRNSTYSLSTKLLSQKVYDISSGKNVSVTLSSSFLTTQQNVLDHIAGIKDNTFEAAKTMVFQFLWAGYVVGPLLAFFSVMGLFFAFCNCRRFVSMLLFMVFGLLGVATWILVALFMATHFVAKQGCSEVFAFNEPRANAVYAFTNCSDTVLSSNQVAAFSDLDSYAVATCELLWSMCYDSSLTPLVNAEAKSVFDCSTLFTYDSSKTAATGCAAVTRSAFASGSLKISTQITDTSTAAGQYALTNGYTCSDGRTSCSASECGYLCTPSAAAHCRR
ncbi:hypothetical protein STCU_09002 [Strigomonas culicis]|uniref:Uncharacterized protein n=1 Tax=Strigomonas culicis TaxID=28005 RepID=S9TPZ6_9TRYP|nr:hypothetical protein STCU_09002 [Strigomonas culicis]|eukprot:EPY20422.1 hypothetical protein STCU_09002 [Strigomonas culicis]